MSELSYFLKENSENEHETEVLVSKRFKNENGDPIFWKIKAISAEKDSRLRSDATKKVPVKGKKGRYTDEFDWNKYADSLCAACVTYPNLNAVSLQESYGVMDSVSLLNTMLKAGELSVLREAVMIENGFDLSMEELVEEAKN